MFFHIFGHIQPDHTVGRAEQLLGKRFAQLGFADAGRSQKQKGGIGTGRVVESYPGAADCPTDRLHRLRLPDDPAGECLLQSQQLL